MHEEGYDSPLIQNFLENFDKTVANSQGKIQSLLKGLHPDSKKYLFATLLRNNEEHPSHTLISEMIREMNPPTDKSYFELKKTLMKYTSTHPEVAKAFDQWNVPEFRSYLCEKDGSLATDARKLYQILRKTSLKEQQVLLPKVLRNNPKANEYAISAAIRAFDHDPSTGKELMAQIAAQADLKPGILEHLHAQAVKQHFEKDFFEALDASGKPKVGFDFIEKLILTNPEKDWIKSIKYLSFNYDPNRVAAFEYFIRHPELANESEIRYLRTPPGFFEKNQALIEKLKQKITEGEPLNLKDAIRRMQVEGNLTLFADSMANSHTAYTSSLNRFAKYISSREPFSKQDLLTVAQAIESVPRTHTAYVAKDDYPKILKELLVSPDESVRRAAVAIKLRISMGSSANNKLLDAFSSAAARKDYRKFFELVDSSEDNIVGDFYEHAVIKDLDFHHEAAQRLIEKKDILFSFSSYSEQEAFWLDFVRKHPDFNNKIVSKLMEEALASGKSSESLREAVMLSRASGLKANDLSKFEARFDPRPTKEVMIAEELKVDPIPAPPCKVGFLSFLKKLVKIKKL